MEKVGEGRRLAFALLSVWAGSRYAPADLPSDYLSKSRIAFHNNGAVIFSDGGRLLISAGGMMSCGQYFITTGRRPGFSPALSDYLRGEKLLDVRPALVDYCSGKGPHHLVMEPKLRDEMLDLLIGDSGDAYGLAWEVE